MSLRRPVLLLTLVLGTCLVLVVTGVTTRGETAQSEGVLWEGGFDRGRIPAGAYGPDCDDDPPPGDRDEYTSLQQLGNTNCADVVEFSQRTRSEDSERSLRVSMAAGQQREQLASTFTWRPDDAGSVDQWYGWSMLYADDWRQGELTEDVSAEGWHSAISWRTTGDNGSLNISGDMNMDNGDGERFRTFDRPHLVLRRNTVLNGKDFYDDGRGLDKLDLGPIVFGRWMDVVCHIRWSTGREEALRECWRDGEYMGKRTTLNAVDTRTHYFRVGQYQTTAIDYRRTTYFDNVRIGTSRDAVDPARDD